MNWYECLNEVNYVDEPNEWDDLQAVVENFIKEILCGSYLACIHITLCGN